MFLDYFCCSKHSNKEGVMAELENARLRCAIFTYNMAAETLVLSNDVIVALSMAL